MLLFCAGHHHQNRTLQWSFGAGGPGVPDVRLSQCAGRAGPQKGLCDRRPGGPQPPQGPSGFTPSAPCWLQFLLANWSWLVSCLGFVCRGSRLRGRRSSGLITLSFLWAILSKWTVGRFLQLTTVRTFIRTSSQFESAGIVSNNKLTTDYAWLSERILTTFIIMLKRQKLTLQLGPQPHQSALFHTAEAIWKSHR